jgi:nitrous oxidase accessory protein NosD
MHPIAIVPGTLLHRTLPLPVIWSRRGYGGHFLRAVVVAALLVAPVTLRAQATKIFVASFGSDANDGSRGAPKRNFQAAHDAVATDGEIVALDTAGYGAVAITKGIGITAPPGITGFVTVSSGDAVTVNAPGATVTLRGLTLTSTARSATGIAVLGVRVLNLFDCTMSGFSEGVDFSPSNAATLAAKNTTLRDCTNGVRVPTLAAANTTVVLDRCRLEACTTAGLVITTSSTGGVSHRAEVHGCLFAGSTGGISLFGASNRLVVSECTFSANTIGITVNTSGASAKVEGSTITGNGTGLSKVAGAVLLSRGNNTVENNNTDGTFSGTYSAK